jgi:putative addiction module CopG family antidote
MTIHLTEEMEFWVSEQVRAGKFVSVDHLIGEALQFLRYAAPPEVQDAELRKLIDEGIRSSEERPSVELTKGLLDSILARGRAKAVSRQAEVS